MSNVFSRAPFIVFLVMIALVSYCASHAGSTGVVLERDIPAQRVQFDDGQKCLVERCTPLKEVPGLYQLLLTDDPQMRRGPWFTAFSLKEREVGEWVKLLRGRYTSHTSRAMDGSIKESLPLAVDPDPVQPPAEGK